MGRMAELAYEQEQDRISDEMSYAEDLHYREQECTRIIKKAQVEPINADEASLLRWACGVQ